MDTNGPSGSGEKTLQPNHLEKTGMSEHLMRTFTAVFLVCGVAVSEVTHGRVEHLTAAQNLVSGTLLERHTCVSRAAPYERGAHTHTHNKAHSGTSCKIIHF